MVSVVIPAYNEEKIISQTLDALANQRTTQKYEVIVVDNSSTDRTAEIARSYKDKMHIKVIEEKKKGRSPARRKGFQEAKGEIIFSTDADTIVPPNWIEAIMRYFSDSTVVAVSGRCKINDCGWFVNSHFNFYQPLAMKVYRLLFRHYWLSGFNFAIRKSVYEKSGGFDTSLNSQEDSELASRVYKLGKIKYIHNPYVVFSGRRFKNGLLRGLWQYAVSWGNYFIFKDMKKTYLSDIR